MADELTTVTAKYAKSQESVAGLRTQVKQLETGQQTLSEEVEKLKVENVKALDKAKRAVSEARRIVTQCLHNAAQLTKECSEFLNKVTE